MEELSFLPTGTETFTSMRKTLVHSEISRLLATPASNTKSTRVYNEVIPCVTMNECVGNAHTLVEEEDLLQDNHEINL